MTARRRDLIIGVLVLSIPAAAAAGWWYYWPIQRLRGAEAAYAAGDWRRALELSVPLTGGEQADPRALLVAGRAARRLRQLDKAENYLTRAARRGADEAAVRKELALTRAEARFSPVVERHLLQSLAEAPDDVEVLAALARGCGERLRWEEADRYYTRALEHRPDDFLLRLDRGHLRLTAASEYQVGSVASARSDFEELVRRDPTHFEARLYLSHCLIADARMADAREHLRVCRRLAADRVEPLIGLASCAIEDRDWDEAERLLQTALAREPSSTYALTMKGDLDLRRERYEDAVRSYREVIAADPANAPARLKLAQSLWALKRDAEADAQMKEYERLTRRPGK